MKVCFQWLNDFVQIGQDPELVARILTDRGLQCESIHPFGTDWVLDVEVTSNRGDCLGLIGIARELASATGQALRLPEPILKYSDVDTSEIVSVEIQEPSLCRRYTARVIQGVNVGPTPDWMRQRLEVVGIRSVCNIVDATNYAMIETGQPPHAFDLEKIAGGRIIVRRARAGESIVSIDGTVCRLDPSMLVIADASSPVAIAGVMGGKATEVSDTTKAILLEDAFFDPVAVRTTARRLGLASEAAYRFGRTVDIEKIDWASARTAELILQVAGGKVCRGVVDVYPDRPRPVQVSLRPPRAAAILGMEIPVEKMLAILGSLGFAPVVQGQRIICTVPSWRSDVSREIDLIEEVARCYGYDKVPTRPTLQIRPTRPDQLQQLCLAIGQFLHGCGFYEAINVDLISQDLARLFAEDGGYLTVRDPAGRPNTALRPTLLGSLVTALRTNLYAKNLPCRLYEIASTFTCQAGGKHPIERLKLGLIADADLRLLRSAIEGAVRAIVPKASVELVQATYHWAQVGAAISVNGIIVGKAGILGQRIKEAMDIKHIWPVCAEIDLQVLLEMPRARPQLEPIPRFPAIVRDLCLLVDTDVSWARIESVIRRNSPPELEQVRFVDLYLGKGVPEGKKSLTLSLRFRDKDGTLQHQQVDAYQQRILESLGSELGARLRGPTE
ncbi:MAG: phenylalanine--tRNA ligase subunit beta [Sedimentisphaerales bacterium]|nr:phenylalanine--tRNA ligase subunit beta [Sedimentisphaerales bacterium]